MRSLLFLLLFIFPFFAKAQVADSGRVIGIHPAVGKLITRDEKIRYHLFPEYKDTAFESAKVIKYNDSTFVLSIHPVNGPELKNRISITELDDLFYRIDDIEKRKAGRNDDYVMTDAEKKEERKRHRSYEDHAFWYNFLAEMTIITFETLITIAFAN